MGLHRVQERVRFSRTSTFGVSASGGARVLAISGSQVERGTKVTKSRFSGLWGVCLFYPESPIPLN